MDLRSHVSLLRDPTHVHVHDADPLLRHHHRFVRTWGWGWAWRGSADGRAWVREGEEGHHRRITSMAAYRAAACHLSAAPSRPWWLVVSGVEGAEERPPFLLLPTRVAATLDVSACLERLLEARDCLPEAFLHSACTVLAEMAQNVCEHSAAPGYVAVCWARDLEGPGGSLGIGVVDAGIGIAGSLAPRFRERGMAAPDAEQAILAALKLDDWPGRRRGTGLCMSRRLIERYDGRLHVRSGGVVLSVGAEARILSSRCARRFAVVPGTQIAIRLRLDVGG